MPDAMTELCPSVTNKHTYLTEVLKLGPYTRFTNIYLTLYEGLNYSRIEDKSQPNILVL